MSEDRNNEVLSLDDEEEYERLEQLSQEFDEFLNKMSLDTNEQTAAPGILFQPLLCKLQQVQKNENDSRNRIRQAIPLCSELIDIVDKATLADVDDFQNRIRPLLEALLVSKFGALVKVERLFAHEMFLVLLDLLCEPKICLYFNDNQEMIPLHKEIYKYLMGFFSTLVDATVDLIPFTSHDIITRKYTDAFCIMYKRVERDLRIRTQAEQPVVRNNETASSILSLLGNVSDQTVIIPWFLGIGLVKSMLECLKLVELTSRIAAQIVNIIYNISRHDSGVDEVNEFDGLAILKDIQSNNTDELDDDKNLTMSMAIALLSTSEQIRSDNKRMNRILNQLLQITMEAAKSEDHREEGFHVSEPLVVFTKLFVDDHSLEYVLGHAETDPQLTVSTTIALFADLLITYGGAFLDKNRLEQFACTALLNILWSISFQDRYKTKLQQNIDLLITIKSLSMNNNEAVVDQYIPRTMESMPKAANGILYNLQGLSDGKEAVVVDTPVLSNAGNEKPTIMISYAHHDNLFCDKLLAEFEQHQHMFGVWIDRDHLSSSDDLWEKIARGIRQSNIVVCLMSQEYFNSKSCRKEATFAIQRKKSIVPVYIGEPGDCDWLDIHIAGLKYVRFTGAHTELDRGKLDELLTTIQSTIRERQREIPQQYRTEQHCIPKRPEKEFGPIRSIVFDMKKPPAEWTVDDIHNWFSNHKVPHTLVKLFDFQSVNEMHEYAAKLRIDPKKEFNKYEQRFVKNHGEELEEYIFNRFKNALLILPHHQPETIATLEPSSETSLVRRMPFFHCTIL